MSDSSNRYIEVIVIPCQWTGTQFVLDGPRTHETMLSRHSDVLNLAISLRGPNKSVIIRPSFVETSDGVRSFREWRSFSGSLFEETRFYCDDERLPNSRIVQDNEVDLPAL